MDGILATAREEVNFAHPNVLVIKVQYHLCMLRLCKLAPRRGWEVGIGRGWGVGRGGTYVSTCHAMLRSYSYTHNIARIITREM